MRYCKLCGSLLEKKSYEINKDFNKRQFCDLHCALAYARTKRTKTTKTHGMSSSSLYKSWQAMKRRCDNPDAHHQKYYINIHYCEEWSKFENFMEWALNNGWEEGLTIERKDNTKNYCPENCEWIPKKEQAKNKRNKSHLIINGVDKSFTEWAEEYGLKESTIRMRIKYGWEEKDLLLPPNSRTRKKVFH